ncbi:MAG TPA: SDR family oxidoreductase [Candidatus Dormibacteraeota bacterium]|nr:SDR family oxidoreductase [Candidatus Dormibacteraeota bacterium]
MRLEPGMRVFITGAASGIGRATALAMAERGLQLFLADVDGTGLEETRRLAEARGATAEARILDVTQLDGVAALADEWHAAHGPMHVVMNVAGVGVFGLIEDMRHADWQRVLGVNLWGTIHVIEHFLPPMIRARRGHLVNIASLAGLVGLPWHAAYCTSKWAVVGLSEVLRYDFRQHGIGVTVVCPGAVDTPLQRTTPILGVPSDRPALIDLHQRFARHALSPDTVARITRDAIERNRFLVITSWDVRLLYFVKRHLPRTHHLMMRLLSPFLNRLRTEGRGI